MAFEPGRATAPFSLAPALAPQNDPTDWLPPEAADKLRKLRQHVADLRAVVPIFEERHEASNANIAAEQHLRRLQAHPSLGGFDLADDDVRVVAARRELEKLAGDLKRLNDLNEVRSAAWRAASHTLASVEAWLKSGRPSGTVLEDHGDASEPRLLKGENILDAVERLRRRARELKADAHRIRSAPYPSSYCKQQARAQVEALAQRGAVSVARLIEHDGPVEFATMRVQSTVFNAQAGAVAFAELPDTLALTAWLHKDALIAALDGEIDAEGDDAAALTPEQREQREAEVMADLLACERDESELVWQAQAQNLPAEHRADCSPVAILGVQIVTAAHANSSPGTSRGMSWEP